MKKTTFKEKLGYGIASLGDSIGYSFAITIVALYKYPLDKRAYNELLESEKNQSL